MSNDKQEVVITDIQIPFLSMVVLMVKWAIAAIPAIMILFILGSMFTGIFSFLFHGGMSNF